MKSNENSVHFGNINLLSNFNKEIMFKQGLIKENGPKCPLIDSSQTDSQNSLKVKKNNKICIFLKLLIGLLWK